MTMSINKQDTIQLTEFISANLAFRESVIELFNHIKEYKQPKIFIDFQDVQSITRSFAHQYVTMKKQCKKTIIELNAAPDISRMFEIVRNNQIKKNC